MRLRQNMTLRVALATAMAAGMSAAVVAQQQASSSDPPVPVHGTTTSTTSRSNSASASPAKPAPVVTDDAALRIEGEKRFRTNCGRCHMAPHKFAPRTMATAVRHMRVRAMITDEDMRLILRYLTQ